MNTSTASTYILSINENFPVAGQKNDSQGFKDSFYNIKSALETISSTILETSEQSIVQFQDNDIGGYNFKNPLVKNGNITAAAPGDGTLPIDYSQANYWPITLLNEGINNLTVSNMPADTSTGVLIVGVSTTTAGTMVAFTSDEAVVINLGPEDQPFKLGSSTPYFFKLWNDYTESTPYIYVKKISQDIINPILGSTISSNTVLGKDASFFSVGLGNLIYSDGNPTAPPPAYGTLLTTFCVDVAKWGNYADGLGGTYPQKIADNSPDCGYVAPPPPPSNGTLLSFYCQQNTFNKIGVYANGTGGTYDQLIEGNSLDCGYVPPIVYDEIITGPTVVSVGQVFSLSISAGSPNTQVTFRLTSGSGSPSQPLSATLDSSGNAVFNNISLSSAGSYGYTFTFAGSGNIRQYSVMGIVMWINIPATTPATYTTPYYLYHSTANFRGYKGIWTPSQSITSNQSNSKIANTNGAALNSGNFSVYQVALSTYGDVQPTLTVGWPYGNGNVFLDTSGGTGFTVTNQNSGTQYIPILGGTAPTAAGTYTFTLTAVAGTAISTLTCNLVVLSNTYNQVVTGPGTVLVNQSFDLNVSRGEPNTLVTLQLTSGSGSPGTAISATLDANGAVVFSGVTLSSEGSYGYTFTFAGDGHVRSYFVTAIPSTLWIQYPVSGPTTYVAYTTPYYLYNITSNILGFRGAWSPSQSLTDNIENSEIVNLNGASLNNINAVKQQVALTTFNNARPTVTVNWSYGDGNVFLDTASPLGNEGFVTTTQGGRTRYIPLLGGTIPSVSGTYDFTITATAGLQSQTITCSLVVIGIDPAAGTLLSEFCNGLDKYGTYANGDGGTYTALIEANALFCRPPVLNEVVTGPITAVVNSAFTVNITGGSANDPFTWTVSGGGSGSGTVNASGNAVISNQGVAPNQLSLGEHTYTVTFGVGITSRVRTYKITIVQPAGTFIRFYCEPNTFNKMSEYANGTGGTYSVLVEANSAFCGYVPPRVYNEIINGPLTSMVNTAFSVSVSDGVPLSSVSWTLGGGGQTLSANLDSNGGGVFNQVGVGANYLAPGTYTWTFTFSGTGHTRTYTHTVQNYNEYISGPGTTTENSAFSVNLYGGVPNTSFSWTVSVNGGAPGGSLTNNLDSGGNGAFNQVGVGANYLPAGIYTYTFTFNATGHVRTYTHTVQSPVVYNETVSGPTNVPVFTSFNISVTGGVPNTTVTETRVGLGTITLNGAGSGTFNGFVGAPIYYRYSFSFAGTGNTRTLAVAGNYTYDIGFSTDYQIYGADLDRAKFIGQQLYSSNTAFTVYINGDPVTRWGLYRVPDVDGLLFWTRGSAGWTYQEIIDSFFSAAEGSNDRDRANTPYKAQGTVQPPDYGDFGGRPLG